MNGLFFYIGLGLGLAAACGLRPYLPTLLAGALGSAEALGVGFTHHFHFLQAGWWLLAVVVVLVIAYAAQLLLRLTPIVENEPRSIWPLEPGATGIPSSSTSTCADEFVPWMKTFVCEPKAP